MRLWCGWSEYFAGRGIRGERPPQMPGEPLTRPRRLEAVTQPLLTIPREPSAAAYASAYVYPSTNAGHRHVFVSRRIAASARANGYSGVDTSTSSMATRASSYSPREKWTLASPAL